jgi:glycosyltransferase involved in cell wall biosynthesis
VDALCALALLLALDVPHTVAEHHLGGMVGRYRGRPMRIAMLSWRYLDNPAAGGAELLTHEILKRLVSVGHEVTCFTAAYPGAPPEGEIDGVRIVRRGSQWSVHLLAWRWLRTRIAQFDRVVDQINTIPFLTPLYVDAGRRRFYIHQLAREYWWRETRGVWRLGAPAGYLLEPSYLRRYRRSRGITVSESTRADLEALGVAPANIAVIPIAIDFEALEELSPKQGPCRTIIVGRLTPAKFVEEGIRAFAELQRSVPDAVLDIVGGGDERYRARLERLTRRLAARDVTFHGRVDAARKLELLERAHVHVFTSHREGWGLTVTEAAAMGTPSVGYAVQGVRDSIGDPALLAPPGDHRAVAALVRELHDDRARYDNVRLAAWGRASSLSYDATARAFAAAIDVTIDAAVPAVSHVR